MNSSILTADQRAQLVALAESQVSSINEYSYKRFVLIKAFRRLLNGDLPEGTTRLDKDAVRVYSGELYQLDGEISFGDGEASQRLQGNRQRREMGDRGLRADVVHDADGMRSSPACFARQACTARAVQSWRERHAAAAAHARGVMEDIRAQPAVADFATLSVALQALRRLAVAER